MSKQCPGEDGGLDILEPAHGPQPESAFSLVTSLFVNSTPKKTGYGLGSEHTSIDFESIQIALAAARIPFSTRSSALQCRILCFWQDLEQKWSTHLLGMNLIRLLRRLLRSCSNWGTDLLTALVAIFARGQMGSENTSIENETVQMALDIPTILIPTHNLAL